MGDFIFEVVFMGVSMNKTEREIGCLQMKDKIERDRESEREREIERQTEIEGERGDRRCERERYKQNKREGETEGVCVIERERE